MNYRLSIHKIEQSCLFDLTWGQGQQLTVSLPYPAQLTALYQSWQRAYLGYYKNALRGRVGAIGQMVSTQVDLHSQLVQAEARLLSEFHKWLKHEALYDLRAALVKSQAQAGAGRIELFVTCTPMEVARLPWEAWEVGIESGLADRIHIVRTPATIRSQTVNRQQFRRGKARVLAILGDETGLNFEGDRTSLNRFNDLLVVTYLGYQPGEDLIALKQRICDAIADPLGWDVLFFAGHSNEASLLDGQISIAPNVALSIRELAPALRKAQQRGLQFALFNSCCGLDIANGLIDLGLSQVAIMREPIHNAVAHSFLVQFLQRLAQFEDVQEALLGACQWLKLEQNLTYPSAHLVPSLFRHPESVPYQMQPMGWKYQLRRWLPSRREAVVVGAIATLSLLPPVQSFLMSQRVGAQALYRDVTNQVTPTTAPPIVLVQIDDTTLQERRIAQPIPIDRSLLADVVTQLTDLNAQVIGIDYLLDRAHAGEQSAADAQLNAALERAVAEQGTWFVLGARRNSQGAWLNVHPDIASLQWSLSGDLWVPFWRVSPRRPQSSRPWPFSYQVAIAHRLAQENRLQPSLTHAGFLQEQLESEIEADSRGMPRRADLHPLTQLSYLFYQRWLQPLLDFSIPPEQVYQTVSAWDLLQSPQQVMQNLGLTSLAEGVVLVAPGGYDEAGFTEPGEDNFAVPLAIAYWRRQAANPGNTLTGGEAHAYMAHHLLAPRLVVPLPDLWLVLLAAVAGKGLWLWGRVQPPQLRRRWQWGLAGGVLGYGLLSLQAYISAAILLPWLLPSLTIAGYVLPLLRNDRYEKE
jgi:hypothetical protein